MYAIAVAEKARKPWIAEYERALRVKVALKSVAAPELKELKKFVVAQRTSPTVPLEVPA